MRKTSLEKYTFDSLMPYLFIVNDSASIYFFPYKSQITTAWSVQNTDSAEISLRQHVEILMIP